MKIARLPNGSPEIFHTLQGEGVSAGVPAIFVRASLCNLHCVWCDTDYTWNWEGTPWPHQRDADPAYTKFKKEEQILELAEAELAAAITEHPCRRLVVTGGEPLLQQEELTSLLRLLREHGEPWVVEIETNGTIRPEPALDPLVDQYNVSPKLANSGNPEELRIREEALTFFAGSPKAWFKFVVTGPPDLKEIEDFQQGLALPAERIILMPEGRDPGTLRQRLPWLAEAGRAHGYRLSDRLQVELWGDLRGR